MSVPVLLTKVTPPQRRDGILTRPRLIELLNDTLDHKLVIITAPAGYGKTTLLVDYARQSDIPICWLSIDSADRDLQRFLTHFTAAIEQRFPHFGRRSMAAIQNNPPGPPSIERLVTIIVNELYETVQEHFILVLDDYHLVDEAKAVNQFINRFIQDVDQNCHLALLTRAYISIPDLPLLAARTQAAGIGHRDLAFRTPEIQRLMLTNYHQVIPADTAQELAHKTEGWITALLLSADSMWQGMVERLGEITATGVGLYAYLIHQVLNRQPADLRNFLLRTSFFEEFDAELCQALLGPPPQGGDWQDYIQAVLKNNLFAVPIGDGRPWLRYHHLFRDFLQNQFLLEQPAEAERALQDLAAIYSLRLEWERAYEICARLGDIDLSADFLEQAGEPLVRSGRTELLGSWLEALPGGVIESRPSLQARYGIVLSTRGQYGRALRLLDQAVGEFRKAGNHMRLAGTLVWRALVHFNRSDAALSMADAQEALDLCAVGEADVQLERFSAEAYRLLGQNARRLGNLQGAIANLTRALAIFHSQGDGRGASQILLSLGPTYLDAGDLAAAQASYRQARQFYIEQSDDFSLASTLNDLAYLEHLDGRYLEAVTTYEEALIKARAGGNHRVQIFVLIGMGDLLADLDAHTSAAEAYRQARDGMGVNEENFLSIYLELAEAANARLTGQHTQAMRLLESAAQLIQKRPSDYSQGAYLIESGQLAMAEDDCRRAVRLLEEAVDLFEGGGQRILAGRAALLRAAALFELGLHQAAAGQLQAAFDLVAEVESRHILTTPARRAKALLSWAITQPGLGRKALELNQQVNSFESGLADIKRTLRFYRALRFHDAVLPLAPPRLRIRAFGAAQIVLDDQLVTGVDRSNPIMRDFLFLLLSTPGGCNRETLCEILWPGCTPDQVKRRFNNTIYRWRRALGQEVILFDGNLYTFSRQLDYDYDVESFDFYLNRARQSDDPAEQMLAYRQVVKLYQGDYLPEVDHIWVLPERERLRQSFLEAGLALAQMNLNGSQHTAALEICRRLISENLCLERAYSLAMQCLVASGDKAAIVGLYETLKESLDTELGAAPSAHIESLYKSLIR